MRACQADAKNDVFNIQQIGIFRTLNYLLFLWFGFVFWPKMGLEDNCFKLFRLFCEMSEHTSQRSSRNLFPRH